MTQIEIILTITQQNNLIRGVPMVFLPFLPKKIFLCSLLIPLSLIFNSATSYSQVKIKEKVGINPISPRLSITTNYSPIEFLFNGARPYSVAVSGPGTISISGSCAGYSTPLLLLTTPAINGTYQVSISSSEDYISTVGFSATWLAPDGNTRFLAGYEMAFYFGGTRTATFTFNEIPPPPPSFDFQIAFDNPLAYANDRSLFVIQYNHDSEPQDKSVALSFAAADPDVVFFDEMLQEELSNSITASLDDYYRYSVTCKSLNSSFPKKVKVVGVSNGLQRSDTLTILQSEYVRAYFEKESLSPGDTVNIIVKKVNNKYGWESNYPDTTHFEVGIKEGCGLGMIMDAGGIKRDYFSCIQQPIRFVVADTISAGADSVVVRVGAPIVREGDVVASSVIPAGNSRQKNKNAVNQNMNIDKAPEVNRKFMAKAANNNYCAAGTYTYTNVDFPVGKISGDCDYIPKCTDQSIDPTWAVNSTYPNGYLGNWLCPTTLINNVKPSYGVFQPLNDNINTAFEEFSISICKNSLTHKNEVTLNMPITLRAILDYCEDFVRTNFIEIPNDNKADIKARISENEAPKAFIDFYNHVQGGMKASYIVKELIMYHESLHGEEYSDRVVKTIWNSEIIFNGKKYSNYSMVLKNVVADCKKVNTLVDLVTNTKKLQNSILSKLLEDIKKLREKFKKDKDEGDMSSERLDKWIEPIRYYQTILREIYPNANYDLNYEM